MNINNKQIKLIEDNYELVKKCVYCMDVYPKDDYIGAADEGLLKAALTYDIDGNVKFSTYAIRCIKNEIKNELRRNIGKRKDKNGNMVHIISYESLDDNFINATSINNDFDDQVILKMQLYRIKDVMCMKKFNIMKKMLKGYSQSEIADKIGVSQGQISKIKKNIEKCIENYLNYDYVDGEKE